MLPVILRRRRRQIVFRQIRFLRHWRKIFSVSETKKTFGAQEQKLANQIGLLRSVSVLIRVLINGRVCCSALLVSVISRVATLLLHRLLTSIIPEKHKKGGKSTKNNKEKKLTEVDCQQLEQTDEEAGKTQTDCLWLQQSEEERTFVQQSLQKLMPTRLRHQWEAIENKGENKNKTSEKKHTRLFSPLQPGLSTLPNPPKTVYCHSICCNLFKKIFQTLQHKISSNLTFCELIQLLLHHSRPHSQKVTSSLSLHQQNLIKKNKQKMKSHQIPKSENDTFCSSQPAATPLISIYPDPSPCLSES